MVMARMHAAAMCLPVEENVGRLDAAHASQHVSTQLMACMEASALDHQSMLL